MKKCINNIMDKYPKIFIEQNLPMSKTCMCWGIKCNIGWYFIIDNLCNYIQNRINKDSTHNGNKIIQVVATQVKEKFGFLHFYYKGGDKQISGAISFAQNLSYVTCEDCGSMENVTQTTGWIVTLCKNCMYEYKKG